MEAALREARERGADTMDIGVDEPDHVARHLYESLGFTNRTGGPDGPVMFVYERELLATAKGLQHQRGTRAWPAGMGVLAPVTDPGADSSRPGPTGGPTGVSILPAEAGWTRWAWARSAYGRGCGKRREGEMASPRPVGSQLRCRKARNGAVSQVVGRRDCVVVMAITFICVGAACGSQTRGRAGRPGVWG
jgi:hypothetical protein